MVTTILDCTVEEYHQRPEISSGMIRCFMTDGPWTCRARYVTREIEGEDSDQKRLGRLFHLGMERPDDWQDAVLQVPELVPDDYGEMTKAEMQTRATTGRGGGMPINRQYKRHKEFLTDFQFMAARDNKLLMTSEELEILKGMIQSVHDNPATRPFVHTGQREVAAIREHDSGLTCRALADVWQEGVRVVDFKTTRHGVLRHFIRDAYSKGYHHQMAHYGHVFNVQETVIIAVRNFKPYETMIYRIPPAVFSEAMEDNSRALLEMKACFEFGDWHSMGWGKVNDLTYEQEVLDPFLGVE
jgi:hypothetical protein